MTPDEQDQIDDAVDFIDYTKIERSQYVIVMIVIARIGILRGLGNTQYRKSQWWIEMSDTYQAIYEAVRSRIPSIDGQAVISAIAAQFDFSYYAAQIKDDAMNILYEQQRPSMLWKPSLKLDGDMWCALYGDDIMSGVAGFGESPALAMSAFDEAWIKKHAVVEQGSE